MKRDRDIIEKKLNTSDKSGESGEVMVEATILVVIIICAIFMTFNFACIYYNRIVVGSVATEAASASGNVYNHSNREPFVGYIPTSFFENKRVLDVYRYWGSSNNFNESTADKAHWYGSYLLLKSEYSTKHDEGYSANIETSCEKRGDLDCTVVNVTISKEYSVFVAYPLGIFGIESPKYTCRASGSAVCYDPIHQMNVMGLYDELTGRLNDKFTVTTSLQTTEEKGFGAVGSTMDVIKGLEPIKKLIQSIRAVLGG